MKVAYGELHRNLGCVTFTDEFLDRLKQLREMVSKHAKDITNNELWTECVMVKVNYGGNDTEEGLAWYLPCDGPMFKNTQVIIDVIPEGSVPYSYWEEGESYLLGLTKDTPSIETMPDVFFSEDVIDSMVMRTCNISMYCSYMEVTKLRDRMPPDHRDLLDQAVRNEVEDNIDKYRDMFKDSFDVELSCAIGEAATNNGGSVRVSCEVDGVDEDILRSFGKAITKAKDTYKVRLYVATGIADSDYLAKVYAPIADIEHHGYILGADPEGKRQFCEKEDINLHVDISDDVEKLLKGTSTKFFSMQTDPIKMLQKGQGQ